jgi:hypothetical protein
MALTSATLSLELQGITASLPEGEPAAITAWADAINNYMLTSQVAGVFLIPSFGTTAKTAMEGAMIGLMTTGATAVQAGVIAYWTALNIPGCWGPTIPPTAPPPGLATLAAALNPAFLSNTASALTTPAAQDAIAAVFHPLMLGGVATLPGPTPTPVL